MTFADDSYLLSRKQVFYLPSERTAEYGCAAPKRCADQRWVVMVSPARLSDTSNQVLALLEGKEHISKDQIFVLSEEGATTQALSETLRSISRHQFTSDDQVLLFYAGQAVFSEEAGEPVLSLSRGTRGSEDLAFSKLFTMLSDLDLNSAGVILNTSVEGRDRYPVEQEVDGKKSGRVSYVNSERASSRWLSAINWSSRTEVVLVGQGLRSDTHDDQAAALLTFISSWEDIYRSPGPANCIGISELFRQAGMRVHKTPASSDLLIYSTTPDQGFCLHRGLPKEVLSAEAAEDGWGEIKLNRSKDVDEDVEVKVNGTLVSTSTKDRLKYGFPLSPGLNFVEGRLVASTEVRAQVSATLSGPPTEATRIVGSGPQFELTLKGPSSRLQHLHTDHVLLEFVIKDKDDSVTTLEVRNQGTIVAQSKRKNSPLVQAREEAVKIPLTQGTNRIQISAFDSHGNMQEISVDAIVENSDQIEAIVIGIDKYTDASVPPLRYAVNDAKAFADLLLRFTTAIGRDIVTLTDDTATLLNLKDSIDKAADNTRQAGRRIEDTNLIFYYAGYGTTVESTKKRCMMPSDVMTSNLVTTCLLAEDLDGRLDRYPWKNTILILDTSYDGVSRPNYRTGEMNFTRDLLEGRTFGQSGAEDTSWRYLFGTRPNRLFIVAGETNSVALESSLQTHGLLTGGIIQGISTLTEESNSGSDSIELPDVYDFVSRTVAKASSGRQFPLMKGSLASPVTLRLSRYVQVRASLRPELIGLYYGVLTGKVESASVRHVEEDLNKIIELQPNDTDAYLEEANVALWVGNVQAARVDLDQANRLIGNGFLPSDPSFLEVTEGGSLPEDGRFDLCTQSIEQCSFSVLTIATWGLDQC